MPDAGYSCPKSRSTSCAGPPLTALPTKCSLFDRGVEADGVLQLTQELGIGFVAYSPLGQGFLLSEHT